MAKKGLGKGLGSFFDSDEIPVITEKLTKSSQGVTEIEITKIEPNKNQPRHTFDKEKLQALAASIKEQGLISPIVVVEQQNGTYMIVAGERRWRAAKLAGLKKVAVVIKDYTETEIAQIAMVENLQREDLNPIEEALGYKSLLEKYSLTQEAISTITGKSRSAIANAIRLLALDEKTQKYIIEGKITSGHARALLSVENTKTRESAAQKIMEDGLSVRETEKLCASLAKEKKVQKSTKKEDAVSVEIKRLEEDLCSSLGTKVKISHTNKKGKIEIEYYGNEDLERILDIIGR